MVQTYLSFLQVQTQNVKMKLEYMRRREEREEKEGLMRREMEKKRMEREREEAEHERIRESVKAKADRAIVSASLICFVWLPPSFGFLVIAGAPSLGNA